MLDLAYSITFPNCAFEHLGLVRPVKRMQSGHHKGELLASDWKLVYLELIANIIRHNTQYHSESEGPQEKDCIDQNKGGCVILS